MKERRRKRHTVKNVERKKIPEICGKKKMTKI